MESTTSYSKLAAQLKVGHVYRRDSLLPFSKAIDRDLILLAKNGILEKIAVGLYYRPEVSRWGTLPPKEEEVVKEFLRDSQFLIYSRNQYNLLGLGLTQIYNSLIVYNHKRHGKFELGKINFDFKRPSRGFPNEISKEFLLVDLVNNLNELAEDTSALKLKIKENFVKFDKEKICVLVKKYGKISTQRLFREFVN
ncbi:MAG: DUF6088 family protein [Bdellovibrionota bacterium]